MKLPVLTKNEDGEVRFLATLDLTCQETKPTCGLFLFQTYINSIMTILSDGDTNVFLSTDMNVNSWTAGRLFLDLTLV